MSGWNGNTINEDANVELRLIRQLKEAELQGKDLSGFLVEENNCFVVDESGNFILPE